MNPANFVTLANTLSGFFAIFLSLNLQLFAAAHLIFLGMVMDFLDGKVARLFGSNEFGKYLDSSADLITFGLAPAVLIASDAALRMHKFVLPALFFYCFCSMFRLVRFCAESKKGGADFSGLPIPAAAGSLVSFYLVFCGAHKAVPAAPLMVLILIVSLLMVSTVPYAHFSKVLKCRSAKFKYSILIVAIAAAIFRVHYALTFILFLTYMTFARTKVELKSAVKTSLTAQVE